MSDRPVSEAEPVPGRVLIVTAEAEYAYVLYKREAAAVKHGAPGRWCRRIGKIWLAEPLPPGGIFRVAGS